MTGRRSILDGDGRYIVHWDLRVFRDRGASPHIRFLDLRTGGSSLVPGPAGLLNLQWVGKIEIITKA